MGPNHYRIKLPDGWGIHDVINVSRLERYHERSGTESEPTLPRTVENEGAESWEVEAILDREWLEETGTLHYKIRWKGDWPEGQKETWEPIELLSGARSSVIEYDKKFPRQPRPPRSNVLQKAIRSGTATRPRRPRGRGNSQSSNAQRAHR
jgi:hypothetical protein